MPHHKAYKKTMRTAEEARQRNRSYRAQMRTLIRKVREAQTKSTGESYLRQAIASLDRLARKGVIHRNNAANHKAKLSKYVSKLPA